MKLKDFPLIAEGMKEIMYDQFLTGMYLKLDADVPEYWEPKFKIAEDGLHAFAGRTLRQVAPILHEMPGYEDLADVDNQNELAIRHFYMPINETAAWLAEAVKMSITEYVYAQLIFEAFFDGELRRVFQGAEPGSPYAQMLAGRPDGD